MIRHTRLVTVFVLALLAAGCAGRQAQQLVEEPGRLAADAGRTAVDVAGCRDQLRGSPRAAGPELDAASIGFLSWNIEKGKRAGWREDLLDLGRGKDLILIQEAIYDPGLTGAFAELNHWSFSPGYQSRSRLTGVITFSRSEPLTRCNLVIREPWLGTPKATSITEYGLTGTDQTLVVVNVHGVNFTFGVTGLKAQIDQLGRVLEVHEGPMIVSGDFNTWRKKRLEVLAALAEHLGLTPLFFGEDHRKKVFGYRLDHVFVRGLTVESAGTRIVQSSDHNPISARLSR